MNTEIKDRISGFIRTLFGAVGFFLVGKNFFGVPLDESTITGMVGIVMVLIALVWAIVDKTLTIEKWESASGQLVLWTGGFIVSRGWLDNEQWVQIAGVVVIVLKYVGGLIARKKAQALADPTNQVVTVAKLKK